MKKFIIQAVALLLVLFGALFFAKNPNVFNPLLRGYQQTQVALKIKDKVIKVEIADSKQERSKGLAGREGLEKDSGMLFIFEKKDKYQFWMKDVKFPLDLIWIDGDNIVEITENVPPAPSNVVAENLPKYISNFAIDKVLEVPGGVSRENNISVGDKIELVR